MTRRRRSPRSAPPPTGERQRRTPKAGRRVQGEWQVYALASGQHPSAIRIGRRVVRVLIVGPIAVLAVRAGDTTYTEAALREQHAIVLGLAERIDPLLPARFGTRMTAADLDTTIRRSSNVLRQALQNVKGRQQMTIRLIGAPTIEQPPVAGRSGAAYLQQRRAAHAIPSELDPMRAAVARFVAEERVSPGRAGVRATLFHLVGRDAVPAYREAVARATETMPSGSVTLTGPWPPFAFAPELAG